MSHIGSRVLVLAPDYIAGELGIALAQELLLDGLPSGYWLIKIQQRGIIVSLLPDEVVWLDDTTTNPSVDQWRPPFL